jgi:cytochrome c553
MASGRKLWCAWVLALLLGAAAQGQEAPDDRARIEFFEARVRPVLAGHCYNCHSANTNSQGGLRVDERNGLMVGGGRGPAVVPGNADGSLLMQAVRHTHGELKMPQGGQLSEAQIADLAQWIADGAAWPAADAPFTVGRDDAEYARLRAEHWAWQPLAEPAVPAVRDAAWPRDDIDRFILARLESAGLAPVGDADPLSLARRLSFDLTGLPPAPDEAEAFAGAWELAGPERRAAVAVELIDRLLASSAFGERWGRHWLDVARYGESTGSARNLPYPHAWRYRDWVIDAFNADKPYDQFLREQVAGDLLPAASQAERDGQLTATGFLALGVCDVNQRFAVRFVMDNIDEQIDTLGRAVLGLAIGCARCHDHKFDPIPIADYYALAGIFHSSDRCAALRNKMGGGGLDYYDTAMLLRLGPDRPADPRLAEIVEQLAAALAEARAALAAIKSGADGNSADDREKRRAAARQRVNRLERALTELSDPVLHGPVALGARDAATVGDTPIRVRGEAEQLGPTVARGFLSALEVPGAAPVDPAGSGRRELAQWLASERNPLTPRVMANRVWKHLFGQGLVRTVDNFGVTGDPPSHPELLDHLAARLVREGWSVKRLVRAIVLSRAYQLATDVPAANLAADPSNRLLWRHAPRRLDAEEIRDGMLAAAGELRSDRPAGSFIQDFKVVELANNGPEARRIEAFALASTHRSIYLPLVRGLVPQPLAVFDFAEQGLVTGDRQQTTVATQALYLLNDPFVRQQSQAMARRLLTEAQPDDARRVDRAYRLALGRPANAAEQARAASYLAAYGMESEGVETREAAWASFCQAILASAEFRYAR